MDKNEKKEIPGQAPYFSDFISEESKQARLAKDWEDYNSAQNELRQNPSSQENMAGKDNQKNNLFRDAQFQADKHNAEYGTNFKAEHQRKIKNSKPIGNMSSHAHQDAETSAIYGDKPVDAKQRASLSSFKDVGKNYTTDTRSSQSQASENVTQESESRSKIQAQVNKEQNNSEQGTDNSQEKGSQSQVNENVTQESESQSNIQVQANKDQSSTAQTTDNSQSSTESQTTSNTQSTSTGQTR